MVESPSLNSFETYKLVALRSEKCEWVRPARMKDDRSGWQIVISDVSFWCTGWLLACIETPQDYLYAR